MHWPHFKCLVTTYGQWLLHQTMEPQKDSLVARYSASGNCNIYWKCTFSDSLVIRLFWTMNHNHLADGNWQWTVTKDGTGRREPFPQLLGEWNSWPETSLDLKTLPFLHAHPQYLDALDWCEAPLFPFFFANNCNFGFVSSLSHEAFQCFQGANKVIVFFFWPFNVLSIFCMLTIDFLLQTLKSLNN